MNDTSAIINVDKSRYCSNLAWSPRTAQSPHLQQIFDTLIDSFIRDKVGVAEDFLSLALSRHLHDNLLRLLSENLFNQSGMGNGKTINHNIATRGDKIYWLDRSHNDLHENTFFDLIDAFVKYLNESCYTGITGYEFHYTIYGEGTFYRRHLDQFRTDSSRQYSMIMYLNEDWQVADGGELCIHQHGTLQLISPMDRKGIFFRSSALEHEVLLTHKPRLSITGWLKVG